jgi:hypothetical protein
MPYILTTEKVKGKTKYCMTAKETGRKYCFSSPADREKGARLHEMFKHMKK